MKRKRPVPSVSLPDQQRTREEPAATDELRVKLAAKILMQYLLENGMLDLDDADIRRVMKHMIQNDRRPHTSEHSENGARDLHPERPDRPSP